MGQLEGSIQGALERDRLIGGYSEDRGAHSVDRRDRDLPRDSALGSLQSYQRETAGCSWEKFFEFVLEGLGWRWPWPPEPAHDGTPEIQEAFVLSVPQELELCESNDALARC